MTNEMFRVLSDLDGISCELAEAVDALTVYSDCMDESLQEVDTNEPWTAELMCSRVPKYDAVLQLVREKLQQCLQDMDSQVQKGFMIYNAGRDSGSNT